MKKIGKYKERMAFRMTEALASKLLEEHERTKMTGSFIVRKILNEHYDITQNS
jgi:hypothetical protein